MPPLWQGPEAHESGFPGSRRHRWGQVSHAHYRCPPLVPDIPELGAFTGTSLTRRHGSRPGRPAPAPFLAWGRTDLAVPPGEAVRAAALVLAACLLARAPVPAGPRAAQAWPGCGGAERDLEVGDQQPEASPHGFPAPGRAWALQPREHRGPSPPGDPHSTLGPLPAQPSCTQGPGTTGPPGGKPARSLATATLSFPPDPAAPEASCPVCPPHRELMSQARACTCTYRRCQSRDASVPTLSPSQGSPLGLLGAQGGTAQQEGACPSRTALIAPHPEVLHRLHVHVLSTPS